MYGPNLLGLEGSEWKRHRAIAKNAFNEANNAFVWRESTRIINEWFATIDSAASHSPAVEIDLLRDLTRATLLIISSAGFGRRSPWVEDANQSKAIGHKANLSSAVIEAVSQIFPRILTPKPIWNAVTQHNVYIPLIGSMVSRARDAFDVLKDHMLEIASEARDRFGINRPKNSDEEADTSAHGAALLKNLVEANMTFEKGGEGGYRSLTDGELFSNMFVSRIFFIYASGSADFYSCSISLVTVSPEPLMAEKAEFLK